GSHIPEITNLTNFSERNRLSVPFIFCTDFPVDLRVHVSFGGRLRGRTMSTIRNGVKVLERCSDLDGATAPMKSGFAPSRPGSDMSLGVPDPATPQTLEARRDEGSRKAKLVSSPPF